MHQNLYGIIFYRIFASVISPLIITLPFFLIWKYQLKKSVTSKSIYMLNAIIPFFESIIYIALLYNRTSESTFPVTFVISLLLYLVSIPLALIIAFINYKITMFIFGLIEKRSTDIKRKYIALVILLSLLIVFFPKSQEYITGWTKDSPPLPGMIRSCFCSGISTRNFFPESDYPYCFGLTYQCVNEEIMHDPLR